MRSVRTMNATTAMPVRAPITSAKTRNICPSRCRSWAMRSDSQPFDLVLVALVSLVGCTLSLTASGSLLVKDIALDSEGGPHRGPPSAYSSLAIKCEVVHAVLLPALFVFLGAEWFFLPVANRADV